MQFDSVAAALAMDGHGVYVWTVAVVSTAVIAGLLLVPYLASRRYLRDLRAGESQAGQNDQAVPAPTAIIEEVRNAPST